MEGVHLRVCARARARVHVCVCWGVGEGEGGGWLRNCAKVKLGAPPLDCEIWFRLRLHICTKISFARNSSLKNY